MIFDPSHSLSLRMSVQSVQHPPCLVRGMQEFGFAERLAFQTWQSEVSLASDKSALGSSGPFPSLTAGLFASNRVKQETEFWGKSLFHIFLSVSLSLSLSLSFILSISLCLTLSLSLCLFKYLLSGRDSALSALSCPCSSGMFLQPVYRVATLPPDFSTSARIEVI